ncbi:MAG: DUF2330 domain-containing protein [Propionibacteriaceae bacterium]|jgi:hypothetical protein|nr:DUF2330 domain-containing protein [Propionibacteriaceae bacterium]
MSIAAPTVQTTSRTLIRLGAIAISLGLLFGFPAAASAAGAFLSAEGTTAVTLNRERAIISLNNGIERIDLKLDVDAFDSSLALIIPTPSPATVTPGSDSTFAYVKREMTMTQTHVDLWWELPPRSQSTSGPDGDDRTTDPSILDRVLLGPFEAVSLESDDAEGLQKWLDTHGYTLPETTSERLKPYLYKGWYFTAIKLTSDYELSGSLVPIRIEFETDDFVYPLALSQAFTPAQQITLYVFADFRATVSNLVTGSVDYTVIWARAVRDKALKPLGSYLTTIELTITEPNRITDDLVIKPAPNDGEVGSTTTVYHHMTFLGIPAGWAITLSIITISFVVIALTVMPDKRRKD